MKYVVRISPNPNREELKWAMKFTVRMRDNYTCQDCGDPGLDVAHILSRANRPDLVYEPSNARVLCRSCHLSVDHREGHRPSGRVIGYRLSEESKRKISQGGRATKADPEWRAAASIRTKAQWDKQGRKPPRDCEHCGTPLPQMLLSRNNRFCSQACRYTFQRGKLRSGW